MHIEKTLAFRVGRSELWDYLRDRDKFVSIGYVERVDVESGAWPQEGARGKVHVRLRDRHYVAPFTVERYRDGSDLVARITGGPLEGAAFYFHASDAPGGAVLTGGFRLGGLLGFAARAGGLQERIAHAVERELVAFKERVERGAGPASVPSS